MHLSTTRIVTLSPAARSAYHMLIADAPDAGALPRGAAPFTIRHGIARLHRTALVHQLVLHRPAPDARIPGIRPPHPARIANASFLDGIISFSAFGRTTTSHEIDGIPYLTNIFWTQKQRNGHALHEIPYRASFKPELPAFLIERLTRSGQVVHDPFMGRGTVPLQAALLGRQARGSDIHPLAVLLARPRLGQITTAQIDEALTTVDWTAGRIKRPDLLAFYHPQTLQQIEALRDWIAIRAVSETQIPAAVDWIRMAALSRLSGHSPGYMSVRTMPPNQMIDVGQQHKLNTRLGQIPPLRGVAGIIRRKSAHLLRDGAVPPGLHHQLMTRDAADSSWLPEGSVDLVVTSPPFADVVDYRHESWLRSWFAGIDTATTAFAHHRDLNAWSAMICRVLIGLARVLRSGGHLAMEVGEIRKGKIDLAAHVWRAAEGLPFQRLAVVVHDHAFTKVSHMTGITNGCLGTNSNRVVVLRRW